ncbi:hypothetical protein SALBM311S_06703 [Streptomyces alboniger]
MKALNPLNTWLPVTESAVGGEEFVRYIEAAANPVVMHIAPDNVTFGPTAVGGRAPWLRDANADPGEPLYRLRRFDLAVVDRTVHELVQDLDVLGQLMLELPVDSTRRWQILRAVERALDAVDLQDIGGTAAAAREVLAPALAAPAGACRRARISAVGHAHIDTAWLWPLRETVRKVARTVSNVTQLMDDHPEFRFVMSRPSSSPGSRSTVPRSTPAPRRRRGPASSCRRAVCGWSPTPISPAASRWSASSSTASGSTWTSSASRPRRCGSRTPSATTRPCR